MSSNLRVIERAVEVERTPRVMQLEGIFDMPPSKRSEQTWNVALPLDERDWQIGMVVGPSGSGKSTILRELWPDALVGGFDWPERGAIVDGFPDTMPVRDVVACLSSVGFSSPPAWLRPFSVLSNGEQFRATVARALAESPELVALDEFTSVVDRTVAQVGSAAIAKSIRRSDRRLIVASCHYDIEDWLQPDWVYQPHLAKFTWRCLQRRPDVDLEVYRTTTDAWAAFRAHHYLSGDIARGARCYVALVDGIPAAFSSMIPFPHARIKSALRMHRTVALPDFQGVGIGNRLAEIAASVGRARGSRVFAVQSHPAVIAHQARSPLWHMIRTPGRVPARGKTSTIAAMRPSIDRITASFEYVGPPADAETLTALSW